MRSAIKWFAASVMVSAFAATMANAQQFTMKMGLPTINDVAHEYFKVLKAGIEQRAPGRIKVEIYPSSQLGQIPTMVEGVSVGTIETVAAANGFWVGLEPRFQIFDAPGLFDNLIHGQKTLSDPAVRRLVSSFGADKGIEVLSVGNYAPMMILAHRPVRAVTDFQGLKVRSQGGAPLQVEPFRKLGALPVSLPFGEALPAMQNRTIDGTITATAAVNAFKYYDVAKPITYLPGTALVVPIIANRQFMKSLPTDLAAIVREEAKKAEVVFADWNVADVKRAEDSWRNNGGEIITLSSSETKLYFDTVIPVANSILSKNVKIKSDYDTVLAVAKQYRH